MNLNESGWILFDVMQMLKNMKNMNKLYSCEN